MELSHTTILISDHDVIPVHDTDLITDHDFIPDTDHNQDLIPDKTPSPPSSDHDQDLIPAPTTTTTTSNDCNSYKTVSTAKSTG